MKYKIKRKKGVIKSWQILFIVIIFLISISISYAMYSTELIVNGIASGIQQQLSVLYLNMGTSTSYPSSIGYMDTFNYTFANSPTIQTITMGENTLVLNTDYTYLNGVLTIPNVTGNLVISGDPQQLTNFNIKYAFGNSVEFDGATSLNTGIQLFSTSTINKDFEMTVDIDSATYKNEPKTAVFNCADHNTAPFPGFTFRNASSTNYIFKVVSTNSNSQEITYPHNDIQTIHLIRTGTKLFAKYNNSSNSVELIDYSNIIRNFNSTLIFGADINNTGNAFRCFTGTLSNMTVTNKYESEDAPVTLPTPTRTGYDFLGWYSDSSFTNRVGGGGTSYTPTSQNITLYAKWGQQGVPQTELPIVYQYAGQYTFDGTNNINTGIKLFDQANYQKDFEISFNIVSIANDNISQASLVNAKFENESANYPGFVYRLDSNLNNLELTARGGTGNPVTKPKNSVQSVKISRIDGILYIKINNEKEKQAYDFISFTNFFNTELTIGSSLQNGQVFRGFKGVLSNIVVRMEQ